MIECESCGRKIEYCENKSLKGVGFDFPFNFMTEWYDYQNSFVSNIDLTKMIEQPVFKDMADVYKVIVYKKKVLHSKDSEILLFGDRVMIKNDKENLLFRFSETSAVTVLGRNKLNIYYDNEVYQFKGNKRFNALKYVNFFYRYNNIVKGETDGKFLGI